MVPNMCKVAKMTLSMMVTVGQMKVSETSLQPRINMTLILLNVATIGLNSSH